MPKEIALEDLDLAEWIRPGDSVTWGQACAEPLCLTERLVAQRESLGSVKLFVGMSLSDTLQAEHGDHFHVTSYGAIGTNDRLSASGALEVLPCNYGSIPQLIESGRLPVDVVLVQVSPPGPDGHYSLGLANDFLLAAMRKARLVIAEVNEQVPCTTLDQPLDEALIDIVVPCSRTPIEFPGANIGNAERRIGSFASEVIEDGAVLQYGIGSVPAAILASLSEHQGLGIHSGMLTDDTIGLLEAGVINNETNRVRPGVSVAALAMGGERLRRYLHLNPAVELHPASTTHGITSLARQDRLVAINSALEVDLYGQVNAEMVNNRYVGAVGGQVDFMHAAASQPRGLSIIAMPSVTNNGKHSRIVAQLANPLVTTCKSDVDIIVTEQGVADLRGKTLKQRALAISSITSPVFREDILRAIHQSPGVHS
jgi:acyl-CoA hydrolase